MNSLGWFRLYQEVLDDPKVQTLEPQTFKFWINCLCLASRHNGALPRLPHIAFALRMEMELVTSLTSKLVATGLLEEKSGTLIPHNWRRRQQTASPLSDFGTEYTADFEKFWAAYPKKVGKGQAFQEWMKQSHPPIDELLLILARAKQTTKWREDNGRYIPNPSTWLHQRRWDDDYTPDTLSDTDKAQIQSIFRKRATI